VLAVVYLIFNEGYGGRGHSDRSAPARTRPRRAHAGRARGARPLALMLLLDARREARFRDGDRVLLADQDIHSWTPPRSPRVGLCSIEPLPGAVASLHRAGGIASTACRRAPATGPRSRAVRRVGPSHRLAGRRAEPRGRRAEAQGPRAGLDIVDVLGLDDYATSTPRGASSCSDRSHRRGLAAYRRALALVHDDASAGSSSAALRARVRPLARASDVSMINRFAGQWCDTCSGRCRARIDAPPVMPAIATTSRSARCPWRRA